MGAANKAALTSELEKTKIAAAQAALDKSKGAVDAEKAAAKAEVDKAKAEGEAAKAVLKAFNEKLQKPLGTMTDVQQALNMFITENAETTNAMKSVLERMSAAIAETKEAAASP